MAEAIVSVVLEKLDSIIRQEVRLVVGIEKEIPELASNLQAIQAVLKDAERRQVKEANGKQWLNELRDACYDVEDLLDEWNTETLKRQIKEEPNALRERKNDAGSEKIFGDAPKMHSNPFDFSSVTDLSGCDRVQTHKTTLPPKYPSTSKLTWDWDSDSIPFTPNLRETEWSDLIWKSSEAMGVDPYDSQASKLRRVVIAIQKLRCITDAKVESLSGSIYSSTTFTDEDMVVAREHNRPLYVLAKIDGVSFQRALIDNGAAVNIMPLSTFEVAKIPKNRLLKETLSGTGLLGKCISLGQVTVDLQVGPIRSETCFHVMGTNSVYHIILGRPWIHEFEGVASTYHQCFKGKFQGKEVVIKASQTPFESDETDLPDAFLYKMSSPKESEVQRVYVGRA